jgi:hypothetical protein
VIPRLPLPDALPHSDVSRLISRLSLLSSNDIVAQPTPTGRMRTVPGMSEFVLMCSSLDTFGGL